MDNATGFVRTVRLIVENIKGGCPVKPLLSRPAWLLLAVGVACHGCSNDKKTAQHSGVDSVRVAGKATPVVSDTVLPGGPPLPTDNPAKPTTWTYENRVEAAGESVTHRASLLSPTRLQFGFPYTGGSTIRLALRERDNDALVSLHVTNGAFNQSFQGGTVRMRFDNAPPVTYPYSAAENGSATVIFLDQPDAIIRRLKTTDEVVVDLDFANQGHRQFTFRTANLRWPY